MVSNRVDISKKKNGNRTGNFKKGKERLHKRINVGNCFGAMFNPNQMMDNPGYMDFNEPDIGSPLLFPPPPPPQQMLRSNGGSMRLPPMPSNGNKKSRINNRRVPLQRRRQWGPPMNMPPVPSMLNQRMPPGGFRPPPRMHPMGPPMRPPMPLMVPPPHNNRFGPRPPIPPPLLGRPPMHMPRPPLGLGGPIPPPPPPRPLPLMPRSNGIGGGINGNSGPQMRRNKNNRRNNRNSKKNKIKKNTNNIITKKQNHINNSNKYPLDKPWINDEIKNEFNKKLDLENKLKGNKNDQLFAEFKIQRDKCVTMYEAARLEYIGKHPEQV